MTKKVLLVDDEKDFLDTLSERLKTRGLDVSSSAEPAEALEIAMNDGYDVIVVDLKMPGMNGIEFLRTIKDARPEMQVILLTGHATVDKGIEAVKLGALDVLEKPANFETLMDRIEKASAKKLVLLEKKDQDKIQDIITKHGW
ncbi:response regulator [Desulfovibrio ferrophilus]|uniref:Response regulator receiver protein n=1 Tax=Desulfovibrio ferrophilus TaxID=241368 RepID=A0A2Z6AW23_9BACT|nr:response regulator [Desulfovibrio ferrophilus]BBD07375.1 response regulator receiver protein [Desulfovibrio ferrophilus]